MRYRLLSSGLISVLLGLSSTGIVFAQSTDWQRALQPDLELSAHLSERLNVRFGVNQEHTPSPLSTHSAFQLLDEGMQFSALLDWSFNNSGMRMTGGALYGDEFAMQSDLPLDALDSDHVSTYVGVGWDNDFGTRGRFGLSLDMGLTFDEATTPLGSDESIDTTAEDASLGGTFQSFRYEPSFSAGVEYRF